MKLRPVKRSPVVRAALRTWGPSEEDVDVDLFAGGGGASEGKRRATGRSPHVAVNHWPTAIRVHEANHPDCEHYVDDFAAMCGIFRERPLLDADGEVIHSRVQATDAPAPKLIWGNAVLARWLDADFGSGCENKQLPAWVFSMQASWRRALLAGYVDADGHIEGRLFSTSSISKALSIGIRLLVASLGTVTSCLYRNAGKPGEIDGRSFMGRDAFLVTWRNDNQKQTTFRDSTHLFSMVKDVSPTGRVETVYCLQVDEDASYVADGIVVHNCTHFSRAKGTRLSPDTIKIRGLAWSVMPWIKQVRPQIIIVENVVEFVCPDVAEALIRAALRLPRDEVRRAA